MWWPLHLLLHWYDSAEIDMPFIFGPFNGICQVMCLVLIAVFFSFLSFILFYIQMCKNLTTSPSLTEIRPFKWQILMLRIMYKREAFVNLALLLEKENCTLIIRRYRHPYLMATLLVRGIRSCLIRLNIWQWCSVGCSWPAVEALQAQHHAKHKMIPSFSSSSASSFSSLPTWLSIIPSSGSRLCCIK